MRTKTNVLWVVTIIALGLLPLSCQKKEPQSPAGGAVDAPSVSTDAAAATAAASAPAFTLMDQEGKAHNLSDYAGKVVVLEWTNPECPYVRFHYAPQQRTMVKLAQKYQPQGVIWLAINSTHFHSQTVNKKWHEEQKLPYPVLDDHVGDAGRAYKAKNTPHVFVIGKDGSIAYQGAVDDDADIKGKAGVNYVDEALTAILAGKLPATKETRPYGCSVKYKS